MITIHTEIRINGKWEHLTVNRLQDKEEALWQTIHKCGDTYVRVYTPITLADIRFVEPECFVHHLSKSALLMVCSSIGESKFNKIFGYFPWDNVGAYAIEEDALSLQKEYGITGIRAIAWRD